MTYHSIIHWFPAEESRDCTTFDGSLQSKMSIINFDHDFWDMLKVKKKIDFSDTMKVSSAILRGEMIKQMDKVKKYNETVSDFVHRVAYDIVYEMECERDG